MARLPFIAGNWKLNLTPAEAVQLAHDLRGQLSHRGDVTVAVFPTTLTLVPVLETLVGTGIETGIQDVHEQSSGAFTGANSAKSARAAGCTRALVGHSERRQLFGETDDLTAKKVNICILTGLLPILCIGETFAERENDLTFEVVERQLLAGLSQLSVDQLGSVTLAYEPVWAIGTGRTATPDQAQEVHARIRSLLRAKFPAWVAEEMRILYGGSVNASNAYELLAATDVDGALVGGASLKASDFASIVDQALSGR